MSDAFLARQALQLGMFLGCKVPGMPLLDMSPIACLVKIPESSVPGQLHAMRNIGQSEPMIPIPPPRPMAHTAGGTPEEHQVTIEDLLAMPRDARQSLANALLNSLRRDDGSEG